MNRPGRFAQCGATFAQDSGREGRNASAAEGICCPVLFDIADGLEGLLAEITCELRENPGLPNFAVGEFGSLGDRHKTAEYAHRAVLGRVVEDQLQRSAVTLHRAVEPHASPERGCIEDGELDDGKPWQARKAFRERLLPRGQLGFESNPQDVRGHHGDDDVARIVDGIEAMHARSRADIFDALDRLPKVKSTCECLCHADREQLRSAFEAKILGAAVIHDQWQESARCARIMEKPEQRNALGVACHDGARDDSKHRPAICRRLIFG